MFAVERRTVRWGPSLLRKEETMFTSDEVVGQAKRTLQNTHPALRHLRVEGSDGALVLSGTVNCYYHKQLAQEALKPLRGDLQLVNHITVNSN
jgi:hypothetical protein